jgi:hypothetical protein
MDMWSSLGLVSTLSKTWFRVNLYLNTIYINIMGATIKIKQEYKISEPFKSLNYKPVSKHKSGSTDYKKSLDFVVQNIYY